MLIVELEFILGPNCDVFGECKAIYQVPYMVKQLLAKTHQQQQQMLYGSG